MIVYPGTGSPARLVEYMTSTAHLMCAPAGSGTVLYSCQKMGSVLGKSVAIVGQGAIGLSFSMITSKMGARDVIGIDPLDYRLAWSREVGATHTINPDHNNVVQAIQQLTEGHGADVVVDAAGYPDTLNMAFRLVRQFGTVMVFGVQSDPMVPIENELLMERQPTIIPTTGGRIPEPMAPIRSMVELKRRGLIDPGALVTHRLAFEEVQRAYDMYEGQRDGVIKVMSL